VKIDTLLYHDYLPKKWHVFNEKQEAIPVRTPDARYKK
jgi:hypothetical protein